MKKILDGYFQRKVIRPARNLKVLLFLGFLLATAGGGFMIYSGMAPGGDRSDLTGGT